MVFAAGTDRPLRFQPATTPVAGTASGPAETPTAAGGARVSVVLLVEDEALLRVTVSEALQDHGFTVVEAHNGEEALEILRNKGADIDWLFTDIRLPGTINGWHVAFEFRFLHPLRPVVYATGWSQDLPPSVAGSLFFRKPYDLEQILEALQTLSARI
ncbi:MAG: response regulator [Burkholderiales bacterium]|nr:response regulator [Burkholderiales bacterium]